MSAKVDQLKLQARWQVWSVTGPEPDYSFFWALFSLAKEPSLVHLSVRPNIMVNRLKKKKLWNASTQQTSVLQQRIQCITRRHSGLTAELFHCAVIPYSMSPPKDLQSVWIYDFSFVLLLSELHETASTWNTVLRET